MKTKLSDFYFDYTNKKQVEWWNKIGRNLTKVAVEQPVINNETNKQIGAFIWLNNSIFNKYVINKMKNLESE
jgi:hypothetical protein